MNENTQLEKITPAEAFAASESDIRTLLPKSLGIDPDRFAVSAWNVWQVVPGIQQCDPWQVISVLKSCAQMGLEPNTPLHECSIVLFAGTPTVIVEKQGRLKLAQQAGIKVDRRPIWREETFRWAIDTETQWVKVLEYVPNENQVYDVAYLRGIWVTHTYVASGLRRHFFFSMKELDARVPPTHKARKQNPLWSGQESWKMYSKTAVHESFKDFVPVTEGERALAIANELEVQQEEIEPLKAIESPKPTGRVPLADRLSPNARIEENAVEVLGEIVNPENGQGTGASEEPPPPEDETLALTSEPPIQQPKREHSFAKYDKVSVLSEKRSGELYVIKSDNKITITDGGESLVGQVVSDGPVNKMYEVKLSNGKIEYNGKQYDKFKFFSSKLELMPW